jgi:hypothetical protein
VSGGNVDPGDSPLEALTDYGRSKVELALFQNCWKATVETAYELRGVASFAVRLSRSCRSARISSILYWAAFVAAGEWN